MNYLKTFLPYVFGNKVGRSLVFSLPDHQTWSNLSFEEQLTFHFLSHSINDFVLALELEKLTNKDIFHLLNFYDLLQKPLQETLKARFGDKLALLHQSLKPAELNSRKLQELLDLENDELTLFALLRPERSKKGFLFIRNREGRFLTKPGGDVWSIPILGHSSRGLAFNHSFGHTPCGIYTIDGVMPKADNPREFGNHRRLIVNFLKPSPHHQEFLQKMPLSHWKLDWWKQSLVGRELGRSLLRIHGTGRINPYIFQTYFPFVPTSGCLATQEMSYLPRKMAHQRHLLDALMKAQALEPIDGNETKIHGILYVVEFNGSCNELRFST